MKKLIIDRFEGDFAVCEQEDKIFINISKNSLPPDVKEGDFIFENDGAYTIDYEITRDIKKVINEKFGKLIKE